MELMIHQFESGIHKKGGTANTNAFLIRTLFPTSQYEYRAFSQTNHSFGD